MTTPSTRPVRFERVLKVRADDIDELGRALLLARATSIWCPLDARTGRPRRIDPALHKYFQEPTHPPSA